MKTEYFDPERVTRYSPVSSMGGVVEVKTGEMVLWSDYERLLELHRHKKKRIKILQDEMRRLTRIRLGTD